MPKAKPRFLFDEDLTGVGRLIQKAREHKRDTWVIGHDPCPIQRATPDEDWLPIAARKHLIVFRIDNDLLSAGSATYQTWHQLGCRGFVINIQQSRATIWNQLRAIIRYWDKIEGHAVDREGDHSWVARLNSSGVKPA